MKVRCFHTGVFLMAWTPALLRANPTAPNFNGNWTTGPVTSNYTNWNGDATIGGSSIGVNADVTITRVTGQIQGTSILTNYGTFVDKVGGQVYYGWDGARILNRGVWQLSASETFVYGRGWGFENDVGGTIRKTGSGNLSMSFNNSPRFTMTNSTIQVDGGDTGQNECHVALMRDRVLISRDGSHGSSAMTILSLSPETFSKSLGSWSQPHPQTASYHNKYMTWPMVEGRIFMRGADGVYCYDLRKK